MAVQLAVEPVDRGDRIETEAGLSGVIGLVLLPLQIIDQMVG